MHSVVETVPYLADAERLFSEKERESIVDMVAADPQCGVVVPGTGGSAKSASPQAGAARAAELA